MTFPLRAPGRVWPCLAATILTACGSSPPTGPGTDPGIPRAVASITAAELVAHVGVISHDSMRGRWTPGPGLEAVGDYLQREFGETGLEPAFGGSWRHEFQIALPTAQTGFNVIGVLQGSDPAFQREYVVVSAHMDHLGVRAAFTDSIFNGADDNASGTSALIEIAEALLELDTRPRRSIIFAAFGGEERGLLGSKAYVAGSLPVGTVVGNLNMDMISRNSADSIAILRSPVQIGQIADAVAARHPELGLTVAADPWPGENLIGRSDQWSFIRAGIGGLLMTSGLHEDYHSADDDVERIDSAKLERVTRLALLILLDLANPDVWTP
jgi:hypothetical protein